MRSSLRRQLVPLFVALAIVVATAGWAAPGPARGSTLPETPRLWWEALVEWLGWSPREIERESGREPQAIRLENQAPSPNLTLWECDPCTDAGPDFDPDG